MGKKKHHKKKQRTRDYAAEAGYGGYGAGMGPGRHAAPPPGYGPDPHMDPAQDAYAYGYGGYGYGGGMAEDMPGMGPGPGAARRQSGGRASAPGLDPATAALLNKSGLDSSSLLQGLPDLLRSRHSEQFLLGLLIGGAAAWVLSDEDLRGKLIKAGIRMYSGIAGSVEELKEQMADVRAEVEAEKHGD